MKIITVLKRDGTREPLALEKWQTQIAKVCAGIADVSQSMIEIRTQLHFYDGITTKEIDGITLRAIVDLIDVEQNPDVGHTNYQHVAGKQRLSMLRKDVYGSYQPPHLYEIVKRNVATGLYTPELLEWYSEDDWNRMNDIIDHAKDEQYSYAAIEQLIEKYLVRNRSTKEIYETPQVRYMVAAATVFHKEEPNTARMRYIKEYYNAASDGLFTLATPVLAGLGTPTKQFSSCVLIRSDDDLDSIFASGEMMAKYASKRAGIGLEIGRLRPLGSPIRGGEIMHTGMIPFLKKWFGDLRSCSQGGIRNASATVFYPIWHHQFDDLIVLKNNQGTEETRVRHMDYGVVLSAFFWRRFKHKQNITFFDPNEVPELYEAFYKDINLFEDLYVKYEARSDLRTKTMSAEEVFKSGILKERTDTGRIYLVRVTFAVKFSYQLNRLSAWMTLMGESRSVRLEVLTGVHSGILKTCAELVEFCRDPCVISLTTKTSYRSNQNYQMTKSSRLASVLLTWLTGMPSAASYTVIQMLWPKSNLGWSTKPIISQKPQLSLLKNVAVAKIRTAPGMVVVCFRGNDELTELTNLRILHQN